MHGLCLPGDFVNPFEPWPEVAAACGLALAVVALALIVSGRAAGSTHVRPWLTVPVVGLGLWSLMLAAWAWTASHTLIVGCVDYVQSWPIPESQAVGVAVTAGLLTTALAVLLVLAGALVVLGRVRRVRQAQARLGT